MTDSLFGLIRISVELHNIKCRFGKCLEVPVYSFGKWWRNFCDTLHFDRISGGKATLLHGAFTWPIFFTRLYQSLQHFARCSRCWSWTVYLHNNRSFDLCVSNGTNDSLFFGLVQ